MNIHNFKPIENNMSNKNLAYSKITNSWHLLFCVIYTKCLFEDCLCLRFSLKKKKNTESNTN